MSKIVHDRLLLDQFHHSAVLQHENNKDQIEWNLCSFLLKCFFKLTPVKTCRGVKYGPFPATTQKIGRFFTYQITNIMDITLYLNLTLTLDIKSP